MKLKSRSEYSRLKKEAREEYDEQIMTLIPEGALCTIANATGIAQSRIYHVLKHFKSEEREKHSYSCVRSRTNRIAETQVIGVTTLSLSETKSKGCGKTTYPTHRLRPIDIVSLGSLYQEVCNLIKELGLPE